MLLWIIVQHGMVEGIHCLGDFLFAGKSHSNSCAQSLSSPLYTCKILGVPVASKKIEGLSMCISYLGILIDTERGNSISPRNQTSPTATRAREMAEKNGLFQARALSLIGCFHHAASVVRSGRPFTHNLIELSKIPKQLNHMVWLNHSSHADSEWWKMFSRSWNGTNFLPFAKAQATHTSNALESWGCGVFLWFHLQWSDMLHPQNIAAMEVLPIQLGSVMWGPKWQVHHILCQYNNQPVMAILNKGSAKDRGLAHLLHCRVQSTCWVNMTEWQMPSQGRIFSCSFLYISTGAGNARPNSMQGGADGSNVGLKLDRAKLKSSLQCYSAKGLVRSTASVYKSAEQKYIFFFCSYFHYQPLPLSEPVFRAFVAYLAHSGLTFRSIKVYISGVC